MASKKVIPIDVDAGGVQRIAALTGAEYMAFTQGNNSRVGQVDDIKGYIMAGNLAGLASPSVARANLGLGSAATFASSAFLQTANNLSDIGNVATARTNLSVYSKAEVDAAIAGGGGGIVTPTIRSSSVTAIAASASVTVAFPAGTAAGDVVVIMVTQDNQINVPAGWTQFLNLGPTQINGSVCAKVMTAGDIATGSVTVTFAANGNGSVSIAAITGSTMKGVRGTFGQQNSNGSVSVSLKSNFPVVQGDLILTIAGNRGNSNNTMTNCTALGTLTVNQSVFFGHFTGNCEVGFAETANFSTAGLGYFVAMISLRG